MFVWRIESYHWYNRYNLWSTSWLSMKKKNYFIVLKFIGFILINNSRQLFKNCWITLSCIQIRNRSLVEFCILSQHSNSLIDTILSVSTIINTYLSCFDWWSIIASIQFHFYSYSPLYIVVVILKRNRMMNYISIHFIGEMEKKYFKLKINTISIILFLIIFDVYQFLCNQL